MNASARIVVVGGCGFIGSRLAISLASAGADVTVLDLASPPPDLARLCHVEARDVTVRDSLRGAVDGASAVYLCAGLLAKRCDEQPARGWAVNVTGTVNVLSEVLETGRRPRVVFLSSGMVYSSRPARHPVAEDAPTEARDLYTASKLAGERIVASAAEAGRIRASVLRLFTVYGPGPASGRRGHFVAGWIERAAEGGPLTIFGDGRQTVDLTHVDDVVQACRLAATVVFTDAGCRAYNVGSGTETRVCDVARWMCEALPSLTVTTGARSTRKVLRRQFGDIARARAELGYAPSVRPEKGITSLLSARCEQADPGPQHAGAIVDESSLL